MLFLQRLAQLLPWPAYTKMQALESATQPDRYWLFYQGLRQQQWKNEAEAALFFDYASPSEKGFRRLKAGMRDRLSAALIWSASNSLFGDTLSPLLQLQQQWALAQVFWHLEEIHLFQRIAKKALELAISQHNYALGWQIAAQLKQTSSGTQLAWIEARLSQCWAQLVVSHRLLAATLAGNQPQPANEIQVPQVGEPTNAEYGIHGPQALQWGYTGRVQLLMAQQTWGAVVETCEKALQVAPMMAASRSFFSQEKAKALYQNGQLEAAIQCLELAAGMFRSGQRWWLQNRLLLAQLYLLDGDYSSVLLLLEAHRKQLGGGDLVAKDQERWRLIAGYLELANRWGQLASGIEPTAGFRLQTLINDLPMHTMDKRGDNLSVWFLTLHFLLLEHRSGINVEERLFNKLEALRKYKSRHLVHQQLPPEAAAFLQLWLLVGKYWMNWPAFQQAARPFEAQLSGRKYLFSAPNRLIPYEVQWKAMLHCLRWASVKASIGQRW